MKTASHPVSSLLAAVIAIAFLALLFPLALVASVIEAVSRRRNFRSTGPTHGTEPIGE